MRAALAICREYGQPPAWWYGLPRADQALMLADMRIRSREARRG